MSNIKHNFFTYALIILAVFSLLGCPKKDAPWLKAGLLNSERIEEKFGSFGGALLVQNPAQDYRLANLYSLEENHRISRTIALTQFNKTMPQKLKAAHKEILDGASIGKTLRNYGFEIRKDILYKGEQKEMPLKILRLMNTNETIFASIIYNLYAQAEGVLYEYCTIAEVYAPQFLGLDELNHILQAESLPYNNFGVKENLLKNAQRKS